jgi:hypothetical protein
VWPLSSGNGKDKEAEDAEASREVLQIAALASRMENQDPVDMAVLLAAGSGAGGEEIEKTAETVGRERAISVTESGVAIPEPEHKVKPARAETGDTAAVARAQSRIAGKVVHFLPFDAKTRRTEVRDF